MYTILNKLWNPEQQYFQKLIKFIFLFEILKLEISKLCLKNYDKIFLAEYSWKLWNSIILCLCFGHPEHNNMEIPAPCKTGLLKLEEFRTRPYCFSFMFTRTPKNAELRGYYQERCLFVLSKISRNFAQQISVAILRTRRMYSTTNKTYRL